MADAVLDSSAVLAFLKREPGAEVVAPVLGRALLPAICLCEAVTKLIDGGVTPERARNSVLSLGFDVVPLDERAALATASLRPATRKAGLSLADRACIALALDRNLPALTADRRWAEATGGADIRLIR